MKRIYVIALAIFITSLSGWAVAEEPNADQVMSNCRSSAAQDEISGPDLTAYLRQCMADAGVSEDDINVRTGIGGPTDEESQGQSGAQSD